MAYLYLDGDSKLKYLVSGGTTKTVADAERLETFLVKTRTHEINDDVTVEFAGVFSALIFANGTNSATYACYLCQGYGKDTNRFHVTPLQSGNNLTYRISADKESITLVCKDTRVTYTVIMFYGILSFFG